MTRFAQILILALFLGGIPDYAHAQANHATCESAYRAEVDKIKVDHRERLKRLAAELENGKGDLQSQVDLANARLVAATKALQNPGQLARNNRDTICSPLLESVEGQSDQIRRLISRRTPDLPDNEWQALSKRIAEAQAVRDGAYEKYQSCLASNASPDAGSDKLQSEFTAASGNLSSAQDRLAKLKSKSREARRAAARQKEKALALAARRRDQCLISGDVFAGEPKLPLDCRCSLALALSELQRAMAHTTAKKAVLKDATRRYRDATSTLLATLGARAAELSASTDKAAANRYVNLLSAFALGGARLAGVKLSKDASALLRAIKADGNSMELAGKVRTLVEVNNARKNLANSQNITNNSRKYAGEIVKLLNATLENGTSDDLAALAMAAQAERKLVDSIVDLSNEEAVRDQLWLAFLNIECVRESCGSAVDDTGLFGTGEADRKRFLAVVFGPGSPAKRLALAECASCKAIALVLELKGYRDVANENVVALEQNIVETQKALMATLRDKTDFLSRDLALGDAAGTASKLMLPVMSIAAIAKSELVPAAVAGELATSVARYFESGIKSDLDNDVSATIELLQGNLETSLDSLAYWRRHADLLDQELIEALNRLHGCLKNACDDNSKTMSTNPDNLQSPPSGLPPGLQSGKTTGGVPVLALPAGNNPLPDCTGIFKAGVTYTPEQAQLRGAMVAACTEELNKAMSLLYQAKTKEFEASSEGSISDQAPRAALRPDCPYVYVPGIEYTAEVIKQRTEMVESCIAAGGVHGN